MSVVELYGGAPRSDRAAAMDAVLHAHWGRALLLLPARETARRRAAAFIDAFQMPGIWGEPIRALDDFAAALLTLEGIPVNRLSNVERRLLFERVTDRLLESGKLDAIGPAAHTRGFLTHIMRIVTRLKQAAIEPEAFRKKTYSRGEAMDEAVAAIYEAYQEALLASGAYDTPGLFWRAALVTQDHRPHLLDGIETVLLDGFDDFTPSEFRFAVALRPHVTRMIFGLNYDPDPSRADLYEIPNGARARIRTAFTVQEQFFEEPPPETATAFAARYAFSRNRVAPPETLRPDIVVAPCADATHEIESTARAVKRLMMEGVPPETIAIVTREPDSADFAARIFSEYGVPLRPDAWPVLTSSASARLFLDLLENAHTWQRDVLLDILTTPWIQHPKPSTSAYRALFPLLTRKARILSGLTEWHVRINRLIEALTTKDLPDINRLRTRFPEALEAARALGEAVKWLDIQLTALPSNAPPASHAREALDLLNVLGMHAAAAAYPEETIRAREMAALEALQGLLEHMREWHAGDTRKESMTEYAGRLRRLFDETPFQPPRPARGVVFMDLAAARSMEFDHVFMLGANEGMIPAPPSANAVYGEQDIESLRKEGIGIEGQRLHGARERLLFFHALHLARKQLTISWRAVSPRGQECLPSPYVMELRAMLPGIIANPPVPTSESFVPAPSGAVSWRDVRNMAFVGNHAIRTAFAHLDASASIESHRRDASPFDGYDGIIEDDCLRVELAARFGENHSFSVEPIEHYLACPFQFLTAHIWECEETETPIAEFDARLRGAILHAALQRFHETFRGRALSEIPEDLACRTMDQITTEIFDKRAPWSITAPPGLLAVERERLRLVTRRYLQIERAKEKEPWRPSYFESAFGNAPGGGGDALTRPEPLIADTPAGPVRFAGRLDRIDLLDTASRVVDYKTGAVPKTKDVQEGLSLQLTLYIWALESLLFSEAPCEEAVFITVGSTQRTTIERDNKRHSWMDRDFNARAAIARAVTGIRNGQFPPTPIDKSECRYCPGKMICRYEAARIERKLPEQHDAAQAEGDADA